MEKIRTDVLVIGAGAAGIRAALAASEAGVDVLMVAKGNIAQAGSSFSRMSRSWGIQALAGEERTDENLKCFYDEIIHVGLGQCGPKLVRILVEESGPRLNDLISYGVRFKKDSQGRYVRVKGCFSEFERAFVTEDTANVKHRFLSIIRRSTVKTMVGCAIDLVIVDAACCGAWFFEETSGLIRVIAKATVLATGGGAGIFTHHLVDRDQIGCGYAMAHRAGAGLTNLEFIQFMLGVKQEGLRAFLPLTTLVEPGMLRDSEGRDLIEKHISDPETRSVSVAERQKHFPFSCRDSSFLVDVAVARECRSKKGVYRSDDAPGKGQPVVVHFSHAFNGGVMINDMAETSIPGLFAAGEVSTGPHGADRIGGCMISAAQVFGKRAGTYAALRAGRLSKTPEPNDHSEIMQKVLSLTRSRRQSEELSTIRLLAEDSFSSHLMILRDKEGLMACSDETENMESRLEEIAEINPVGYVALKNLLTVGSLISESALKREESKGPHFRSDFPPAPDRYSG